MYFNELFHPLIFCEIYNFLNCNLQIVVTWKETKECKYFQKTIWFLIPHVVSFRNIDPVIFQYLRHVTTCMLIYLHVLWFLILKLSVQLSNHWCIIGYLWMCSKCLYIIGGGVGLWPHPTQYLYLCEDMTDHWSS